MNFTQTVLMMALLILATIVMLVFTRREMRLIRTEAVWMMALNVGFGLWMTTEAFGITSLLGGSAPP